MQPDPQHQRGGADRLRINGKTDMPCSDERGRTSQKSAHCGMGSRRVVGECGPLNGSRSYAETRRGRTHAELPRTWARHKGYVRSLSTQPVPGAM